MAEATIKDVKDFFGFESETIDSHVEHPTHVRDFVAKFDKGEYPWLVRS